MSKIITFSLLTTLLLTTTPTLAQAPKKNYLCAKYDSEEQDRFVGVIATDEACEMLVKILNQWAKAPPVSPMTFSCKPAPVQA